MNRPTVCILFGITGDLSLKKLLPALLLMHGRGELPNTRIVGFSRRQFSESEIRSFIKENLPSSTESFLNIISYVSGNFDEVSAYKNLSHYLLDKIDKELGECSNKLFFLATPPSMYESICTNISISGLSVPCGGDQGFARVLIEKPFGKDLDTAIRLDSLLGKLFKEEQIYRIDHYLAKDSLIDILKVHRVSEQHGNIWNSENIEKVEIDIFETATVGLRGTFYDGIGALRDVGQNHMLQMVALIAMDLPVNKDPSQIQNNRAEVLEKIVPPSEDDLEKMKFGQYDGYLLEPGVENSSRTETLFEVTLFLDKQNFRKVPFVLRYGKALSEKNSQISIYFKNKTTLTIPVPSEDSGRAYQKILRDCMVGDQTVFISTREVMAEWKYITPILNKMHTSHFVCYEKGSRPDEIFKS